MRVNRRLQKIERLLQKEINELFRLKTQQYIKEALIVSVTTVRISLDLSVAKVFLSIYHSNSNETVKIMQNIEQNKKTIRYDLGLRISKQIKYIPKLLFFIDNSLDYMENIDYLLNSTEKV